MSALSLKMLFEAPMVAEINVFDFDDTLVKTRSHIYLTTKDGESRSLTPGEYAVYEPKPGDSFDFSDFHHVKNPTPIMHMLLKLRYAIRTLGPDNVFILTARGNPGPIKTFLEEMGVSDIEVVALGNSDPQAKADVIKREILERDVQIVKFYDDSAKNVAAVKSLKFDSQIPRYVRIISVKV